MACDTPPPSSPTPSPHAQGSASPAPPAPHAPDLSHLSPEYLAGCLASRPTPLPRVPSKRPTSPLSPPQCPAPCARGSLGSLPHPTPVPPSCTCHSHGWASCQVHLTWDSSPLRALPHTLATSSPPFIYSAALHPRLKAQVSAYSDCSWDPMDARIATFTYAGRTSRHSLPPLALSQLALNKRLPSVLVPSVSLRSLALRPSFATWLPFSTPFTTLLTDLRHVIVYRVHSVPVAVD